MTAGPWTGCEQPWFDEIDRLMGPINRLRAVGRRRQLPPQVKAMSARDRVPRYTEFLAKDGLSLRRVSWASSGGRNAAWAAAAKSFRPQERQRS